MKSLRESLPDEPMSLLKSWLDDAKQLRQTPNPNAMTLTTVAHQKAQVLPSSRIVLCKEFNAVDGYLVFYTNYESRKGSELAQDPAAAAVFHWDGAGRQARIEGQVLRSPASESDAYFASRPRGSQLGAWASAQSEPIGSRAALVSQLEQVQARFSKTKVIPRPEHWGGYRLWASAVELWMQGDDRIHDRGRWVRTLARDDDGVLHPDRWSVVRLQP